jgi:hypothetical protein
MSSLKPPSGGSSGASIGSDYEEVEVETEVEVEDDEEEKGQEGDVQAHSQLGNGQDDEADKQANDPAADRSSVEAAEKPEGSVASAASDPDMEESTVDAEYATFLDRRDPGPADASPINTTSAAPQAGQAAPNMEGASEFEQIDMAVQRVVGDLTSTFANAFSGKATDRASSPAAGFANFTNHFSSLFGQSQAASAPSAEALARKVCCHNLQW